MAWDEELLLLDNAALDAADDGVGAAVNTEGGYFAEVRVWVKEVSETTTPLLDIDIEASIDGGSNYFKILRFPQIDENDDPASGVNAIEIARPCWVPRKLTTQDNVKVRCNTVVAGASAEFDVEIRMRHLVSAAQQEFVPLSAAGTGQPWGTPQGFDYLT